ncbi:Ferredoxin subunit of nitrite reductase or a ring-hydroxylating dioxygenase [Thermomonospora echinospora]|uniref:Ferredoxin subunit of nitrite reductase or a ring-hydroxylating dioxygenase n=1 Tax=Thermomonospora echinospora TaxID=1992 RepID=A0A1H6CE87_9ACTN|nr:Rieske 2Fe-2S domain-containing protein [Thermomonospora echinospora]SEG71143.1 Ferredoxin subunit of nitrite reductase or a ring-hydroxylating dioxygenase [Thermomonospora echinospora]
MSERASKMFRRGSRPGATRLADAVEDLEHADGLDGAIRTISSAISRVLRPGPVKDLLHGVPVGHPAHPPLTDVSVGCWTSAAILDLLPGTERASRTLIIAGLVGAVPTVLTGWTDWSALHREQQRVGLVHASANGTAAVLYTASLAARRRGLTGAGRLLGFAGFAAVLTGAYLGGHLAFRQAAGANHADKVAHLVSLGWHDLCSVEDLPDGWPVQRRLGYITMFVLRQGEEIHVLADRCAHLGGPLHQGRIITDRDEETCVVCPWHGSTFRVADGSVVHGPATARQPSFETRVENGTLQVRPVS